MLRTFKVVEEAAARKLNIVDRPLSPRLLSDIQISFRLEFL